jgi:RNA polymerase sigma factor (sigma-70 family)
VASGSTGLVRHRRPHSRLSDAALLGLAADGDADAYSEFYVRHRGSVVAFLRARTGRSETAADLLAETFVAALESLRSGGQVPPSPVGWVMTIARNKLIDSWRRGRVEDEARRRLGLEPLILTDADVFEIDELSARTDVAVDLARQLPADQFAALAAHVLDERSYEEIARELETSPAVVRKRVSRALRALRTGLGRDA